MTEPNAPASKPHDGFRWTLFSVALLAGTGGHWLALASLHLLTHGKAPIWLIAAALIASLALARLVHLLRQRHRWPQTWKQSLPQIVLAWAVFIAALWFAVTSETFLHGWLADTGWGDPSILMAILGFFLLVLSLPVYERLLEGIRDVHDLNLRQDTTPEDAEAMILFGVRAEYV